MTSTKPSAYDLHCYIEQHRKPDDILYAVVDGARDYRLALASRDVLGEPLRPLFFKAPRHMDRVGPYVVRITPGKRYPDYLKLWAERMGDNAGILLLSPAWPKAMVGHLRALFRVRDEKGKMFFFRYYDPRVLRTYLPTCTARECRDFFGPVRSFFVEGEEANTMNHYRIGKAAVHLENESITDTGQGNAWPESADCQDVDLPV